MLTRQKLPEGAKGVDGMLTLLTDRIDNEVLDAAGSKLTIVANYAVEFNTFDLAAGTARKTPMATTPGVLTDTTADLAIALLLNMAQRVVSANLFTRAGKYQGRTSLLFVGDDIRHKTLGIMGLGRISYAMARRTSGFDSRLLYTDARRAFPEIEREVNAEFVGKDTLPREQSFISGHMPLTPKRWHILKARDFALIKKSTYVINTARGEAKRARLGRRTQGWQDWRDRPGRLLARAGHPSGTDGQGQRHHPAPYHQHLHSAENLIAMLLRGQCPPKILN